MYECRFCGSHNILYGGISDGLGDYGDSICDNWICNDCHGEWEDDCIEYIADILDLREPDNPFVVSSDGDVIIDPLDLPDNLDDWNAIPF